MARVVTQARVRARARRRQWFWEHRRAVAVATAGALVLVVAETFWTLGTTGGGRFTYYLLGVGHAVIVAVLVGGLHTVYLLHDGEGTNQLRGAWGEENTRDELRKAQRKRLIWGAQHDVRLRSGDLDHVVVTRRGGVVVLDSKWRSLADDRAPAELAARARRVRTRADALVDTLIPRGGRARHRGDRVTVRPAVVVWGALASRLPDGYSADGVDVIAGAELCAWLARLDGDPVTRDKATQFLAAVESFSAEVAARGAASSPLPARG